MIDLSVIIPVYNAEPYIEEAINSLLCQSDISIEIILINDGSTDNSLQIINSIINNNIRVISTSNKGAAAARNLGASLASGEYIMFLDADDYLEDHTICSTAINIIKDQNIDIFIFSYKYKDDITGKICKIKAYNQEVLQKNGSSELFISLIKDGIFPASPCYRVIKKDFLQKHNIKFKEGFYSEDIEWCINIFAHEPTTFVINNNSYIYRKAVKSSVTASYSEKKCSDFIKMIMDSIEITKHISNTNLQYALFSAIAYEYCILLGYIYNINQPNLHKQTQTLSWLFQYTLFPKINYIKYCFNLLGYKWTSFLLSKYIKYLSKSSY